MNGIAPSPAQASPAPVPPASALAPRRAGTDTDRENLAYLHRDCAIDRPEGFQALSKVEVHANRRHILATLDAVDDTHIAACHELGLSENAISRLGIPDGYPTTVQHAEPPAPITVLGRKISGERRPHYRIRSRCDADLTLARAACTRPTGDTIGRAGRLPQVFVDF